MVLIVSPALRLQVYVNRLIIADTVEQRILDLQARKQGQSDAALGEGTGKKLKKLTVKDLQAVRRPSFSRAPLPGELTSDLSALPPPSLQLFG